jgi:hypothetical protein
VRDGMGTMVVAKSSSRVGHLEPMIAEALGALEAAQFYRGLGYNWVCVKNQRKQRKTPKQRRGRRR